MKAIYLAFVLALSIFLPTQATAKRVAFVVGVDLYDNLPPLKKAVGDARAVKALLDQREEAGSVSLLENPTRQAFWQGWEAFLSDVEKGDEVFVHISSHGVEVDGANYLLPRDAPPANRGQRVITQEGIRFAELLFDLSAKEPRIVLFVLDACRDNPYRVRGQRGLGGERGLAPVDPPSGVFVLYSAGVNETALDRLSENDPVPTSVYTRVLLPLLQTEKLSIQDVAVLVRQFVAGEAARVNHKQHPAYYDNILSGAYCFSGCLVRTREEIPPSGGMNVAADDLPRDLHTTLNRMERSLRMAADRTGGSFKTNHTIARRAIEEAGEALNDYNAACGSTDAGSAPAQACEYWKTEAVKRISASIQEWKKLSEPEAPAETRGRKGKAEER